jgi:hypothetical protein
MINRKPSVRTYVHLPVEQHAALEAHSRSSGVTQAEIIRRALASHMPSPDPARGTCVNCGEPEPCENCSECDLCGEVCGPSLCTVCEGSHYDNCAGDCPELAADD